MSSRNMKNIMKEVNTQEEEAKKEREREREQVQEQGRTMDFTLCSAWTIRDLLPPNRLPPWFPPPYLIV